MTGTPPASRELVFDREILFVSAASDPFIAIPWFFRARSRPSGVFHERNVWVHRGGTWEALAQEGEAGPISRTPWRMLPSGRIRLVVGEDDRLDVLVLRGSPTEMEVRLVDFLTEWTRPGGEPIRLLSGRADFPSGPVPGWVLDLPRRWETGGAAPGDWIFLLGGADEQILLEELPSPPDARVTTRYRAWSRRGSEQSVWPNVTVRWEDMRPFERARRNIPSEWILSAPGGVLSGELASSSSHLAAGEGDGPLLPVSGLFAVTGTLRIEGREVSVVGVVRHVQR